MFTEEQQEKIRQLLIDITRPEVYSKTTLVGMHQHVCHFLEQVLVCDMPTSRFLQYRRLFQNPIFLGKRELSEIDPLRFGTVVNILYNEILRADSLYAMYDEFSALWTLFNQKLQDYQDGCAGMLGVPPVPEWYMQQAMLSVCIRELYNVSLTAKEFDEILEKAVIDKNSSDRQPHNWDEQKGWISFKLGRLLASKNLK